MKFAIPFIALFYLIYYGFLSIGFNMEFSLAAAYFAFSFILLIFGLFPDLSSNDFVAHLLSRILPRLFITIRKWLFRLIILFSLIFFYFLHTAITDPEYFQYNLDLFTRYLESDYPNLNLDYFVENYLKKPGFLKKTRDKFVYWSLVLFCLIWLIFSYLSKGVER